METTEKKEVKETERNEIGDKNLTTEKRVDLRIRGILTRFEETDKA